MRAKWHAWSTIPVRNLPCFSRIELHCGQKLLIRIQIPHSHTLLAWCNFAQIIWFQIKHETEMFYSFPYCVSLPVHTHLTWSTLSWIRHMFAWNTEWTITAQKTRFSIMPHYTSEFLYFFISPLVNSQFIIASKWIIFFPWRILLLFRFGIELCSSIYKHTLISQTKSYQRQLNCFETSFKPIQYIWCTWWIWRAPSHTDTHARAQKPKTKL